MRWHKTNDAQHYATVPLFLIDVAVQLLPHRSTLNQRAVCNMVILFHGQVLRADFRHGWRLLRQPQSLFQHGVTSLGRVTLFHDMTYFARLASHCFLLTYAHISSLLIQNYILFCK